MEFRDGLYESGVDEAPQQGLRSAPRPWYQAEPLGDSILNRISRGDLAGPRPVARTPNVEETTAARVSILDRLSRGEAIDPQELQIRDQEAATASREFGKALRRSGYSAAATVKGFAGQLLENVAPEAGRALMRSGQETIRDMPPELAPEINSFEEARAGGLRGLSLYGASALGEGGASILPPIAGGLVGGLLGRTPAGRVIGGLAASLPMAAGEVALNIQDDPRALANTTPAERTALMLGRGGVNAALETVVPEALVVPRLLGKAARTAPGVLPALTNVATTGLAGGIGEFGTEAAQDLTGQAALNIARGDPISNLDLGQAGEAGIRGALPGGVIGGVAGGVQSLYSNVGAAKDAVKAKAPTLDDIIGGIANAAENPQEMGARLTNMTLDQLSKTPEFLSKAREYGLKGLDAGADFIQQLKRETDRYIIKNVSPENREKYTQWSANLENATSSDWGLFKRALEAETGVKFADNLGTFANIAGERAAKNAGETWSWLSDFSKGIAGAVKDRAAGDAKQSAIIPTINQRRALLESIANVSPTLRKQIFGKGATENDRKQLASLIANQLADGGMSYYSDENLQRDPKRKAFLDNWKASTGTDFRKVMQAAQEGLNNVDVREITESSLDAFMAESGISFDDRDALIALSKTQNYDDLKPYEKQFLTTLLVSGGGASPKARREWLAKLKGAESFASLTREQQQEIDRMAGVAKNEGAARQLHSQLVKTVDEDLQRVEQQMPGAGMSQLGGQLSRAEILDTEGAAAVSGLEEGSDRATTDYGSDALDASARPVTDNSLIEVGGERNLRVKNSILAGERSPFDEKAFAASLVQEGFKNNPDTSIDVEIEVDPETLPEGVTLTNAQIANALGGKRVGKQEFKPYADNEVNAEGPLKLRVNPMSISRMARDEAFRDQFAPYIGTYDEMEGMSENARRGRAFAGALGVLDTNGIEIDPEVFGLPAGNPIRLKVNADLAEVKDSLIINREGKKVTTLRGLKKESSKPLPKPQRRAVEAIREAYKNEDLTRGDMEELAYYAGVAKENNGSLPASVAAEFDKKFGAFVVPARKRFKLKNLGRGRISFYRNIVSPSLPRIEALPSPEEILEIADSVDMGNEEFLDMLTSRREVADTPDAEFDAAVKQPENVAATIGKATDAIDAKKQKALGIKRPALTPEIESEIRAVGDIAVAIEDAKTAADLISLASRIDREGIPGRQRKVLKRKFRAQAEKLGVDLKEITAARPLEARMADTIESAKTPIRLKSIGKRIDALKNSLDEAALGRLREKYAAKMTALTSPPSDGGNGGNDGDGDSPLPSSDAQKRFLEVVERIMGKRVRVQFEQTLQDGGAAETVARSKRERLDQLRTMRRDLLDKLRNETEAKKKSDIEKKIAKIEEEERKVDRDEAVLSIIRVATGREVQAGLAEHEAFHAAFKVFFTPEERGVITTAFTKGLVARRLREVFKDEPDVLAAIDRDPEEAAAYAFQIWSRDPDLLKLGERVDNLFNKFLKWVRNLFGVLTYEERAELLLNDLASGRRAEQGTSPVAKILDKDRPWSERAQKYAQDLYDLVQKGHDVILGSVYNRLADSGNPILAKIARAGYQPTGEEGGAGMVQRAITEIKRLSNRLDAIFKGLNDEELKALQDAKVANVRPTNEKLAARYDALGKFFDDMYKYQTEAGIDLGDRGTGGNYYPLTWDPEKVLKDKAGFIKMLEPYAEQLRDMKKTPLEIWQGITEYIDRGEDLVSVMGQNDEPLSESSRVRSLDFISRDDRRQFMVDSPIETAVRYVKQAVRQTEFVRAYGVNGSKLKAWKAEAMETYGATQDDMALVNDYIDGLLGNKEIGMSRELKDLYGALTVYQNVRLLPFSLFNSLVDPLGIAIRSNSMGDAWGVFTYSLKNLFRDWKSEYTPDQWEQIAVDYGIVERSGTSINADNLYTGITLRGTTKKINDAFFKYNLLNGWIRSNTIAAVKMSQRFMYRSSTNFFGEEQSKRYLDELGLKAEDIVLGPDGERILIHADELMAAGKSEQEAEAAAERIRLATEQFVRQSLLNPTSAELPNWASNPYFMPIAHLKSFVFGFNRTIIDRVQNEMANDNFKPLLVATAYVPGMIAATFLKDMASGFGEEPPYKKDWGVMDYLQEGVAKSGFTGTGQFFADMQQDIQFGGHGYESLAGPTLGQLQKGLKVMTNGDDDDFWRFVVKSLPANPVYDQWMLPNY